MSRTTILISLFVVVALLATAIVPSAVLASAAGSRNAALALTAGALYSAIRGWTLPAVGLGIGAAYAWNQYSNERAAENYGYYYPYSGYGYYPYSSYGPYYSPYAGYAAPAYPYYYPY